MKNNSNDEEEIFYGTNEIKKEFIPHPLLNSASNFSFDDENYPIKKTRELLEKSKKETDENIKLSLLEE